MSQHNSSDFLLPNRDHLIRRGLKLNHLRLISALKDTGQMGAAAAQLAISQPAASRMAAEMEDIVGVPLHARHARGIVLTHHGERLAARAASLLQGLDDTARELAELESGHRGSVSIGSVTGATLDLILPAVRQARVTHPGISITLSVDTSDKLAEDLLAARLDFYVGRLFGDFDPGAFRTIEIGSEPVSLVVRQDHPLLRKPNLTLNDCVAFDWVLQERGALLRQTVESYLMAAGAGLPAKILSTSSVLTTVAYLIQTNAIAPFATAVADLFGSESGLGRPIGTLPVAPDLAIRPYSLVMSAERALSPASRILSGFVMDAVEARTRPEAI